jgi:hypothetical protein
MEEGGEVNITAAFIQYLLGIQAVTDLVGTRIRPLRTNQNPLKGKGGLVQDGDTMPRITIDRISNPRTPCLTGATTLANPRIQVDVLASTYSESRDVAEALRNCLDGYRGMMAEVFVDSCLLDDERDFDDPSTGLDEAATVGVSMDFILHHQEDVPNNVPFLE